MHLFLYMSWSSLWLRPTDVSIMLIRSDRFADQLHHPSAFVTLGYILGDYSNYSIDGLVHVCGNSSALAIEFPHSFSDTLISKWTRDLTISVAISLHGIHFGRPIDTDMARFDWPLRFLKCNLCVAFTVVIMSTALKRTSSVNISWSMHV